MKVIFFGRFSPNVTQCVILKYNRVFLNHKTRLAKIIVIMKLLIFYAVL